MVAGSYLQTGRAISLNLWLQTARTENIMYSNKFALYWG